VATAWYTCLIGCLAQFCVVSDQIKHFFEAKEPHTFHEWARKKILRFRDFLKVPIRYLFGSWPTVLSLFRRGYGMIKTLLFKDHVHLKTFSQILLDTLCDLQIVTGTAMLIAALVQANSITFYHQQLVSNFWNLTLNSFWIARAGDKDKDGEAKIWHVRTRLFAILCSVVISTVYQTQILLKQTRQWDPFSSGYRYLYHDTSTTGSQWMWITGLALYSTYLFLYLTSLRKDREGWLQETSDNFGEWVKKRYSKFWRWVLFDDERPRMGPRHTKTFKVVSCIPLILNWFFLQFLALWSFGDDESVLLILVYTGFAAWNTYDIIDLKLSNTSLLNGTENSWGFGQVLPVVLLALLLLATFDAAESESFPITTLLRGYCI
jgi:hypothetical protein